MFPQELCDVVIDHLCAYPAALTACSVVSHAWRATSLRWLFETVTVIDKPDDQNRFDSFTSFLTNSPHIAGRVVNLHFRSGPYTITTLTLTQLILILSKLAHLRSLSLAALTLCGDPPTPLPAVPALESLTLTRVMQVIPRNKDRVLFFMLNLFPFLQELSLHEYHDNFLPLPGQPSLPKVTLQKLDLVNPSVQLLSFLQNCIVACTSLVIRCPVPLSGLGRMIGIVSSSVESICFIEVGHRGSKASSWSSYPSQLIFVVQDYSPLNLHTCTSLQTATIRIGPSYARPWAATSHILLNLPHTCRRIGIAMLRAEMDLTAIGGGVHQLGPIFDRFTNLERVVIGFADVWEPTSKASVEKLSRYEKVIRLALSGLDERGILEWQLDYDGLVV